MFFILSGLLLIISYRKLASFLLLISVGFIVVTRDNPYLHNNMKSITKERTEKILGIIRNLVFIGIALILLLDGGEPRVEIVK